jgi:trimeric autotransporter adhesin
MNPLIQLKEATPVFLVALACFGLLPTTQAVSPAPDGCYPGFTTAEGCNALNFLTTGVGNTGVGWYTLFANSTGSYNTAIGAGALALSTADQNTATGAGALLSNTTGLLNTANGAFALVNNTIGAGNTASGQAALAANTSGQNNTAYGAEALNFNTLGNFNMALGVQAGHNVTTADNVICIGTVGANVSNSCYIGQIFGVTSSGGTAVFINSDGRLGTITSSRRFKHDIKPIDSTSEELFALRPVTFCYNEEIDPEGIPQFGLVAEEVEKVNPDLIVRDKEGKPYSVRYDQVNAMLLNEFLKEHQTVQQLKCALAKQEAAIAQQATDFQSELAEQQKEMEIVVARLKEHDLTIQSVNDQLKLSKPAPRVAAGDR